MTPADVNEVIARLAVRLALSSDPRLSDAPPCTLSPLSDPSDRLRLRLGCPSAMSMRVVQPRRSVSPTDIDGGMRSPGGAAHGPSDQMPVLSVANAVVRLLSWRPKVNVSGGGPSDLGVASRM